MISISKHLLDVVQENIEARGLWPVIIELAQIADEHEQAKLAAASQPASQSVDESVNATVLIVTPGLGFQAGERVLVRDWKAAKAQAIAEVEAQRAAGFDDFSDLLD
jgi:hypothetical protein